MAWTISQTYTQVNDYSVKDGLTSGDPEKIVLGADIDDELSGIATALNLKLDAGSVSSQAEAEAGTDTESVMTPQGVQYWGDANGGVVGDLRALADPNDDRILFWDDSAGAAAFLDIGDGLDITATTLSLPSSVAGDGIAYASGVLSVNVGSGIEIDTDTLGLIDVTAAAGQPINISSGTFSFVMSSLDTLSIETLSQSQDSILVSDNGTLKLLPVDQAGSKIVASSTKTLDDDSDVNQIYVNTTVSTHTITVAPESTYDFPVGTEVGFLCENTGQITLVAGSGVTINSLNSNLSVKASGGGAYLVKTGTNIWTLVGDLD